MVNFLHYFFKQLLHINKISITYRKEVGIGCTVVSIAAFQKKSLIFLFRKFVFKL